MPTSAPRPRARSSLASLDDVTITRAPQSLAICTAVDDTPPPTPMTSTSCPGPTRPCVTTIRQAVMLVRTNDAASSYFTCAGRGRTLSARTATSSARPPGTCSPRMPYFTHRLSSPAAQNSQRSQVRLGLTATRSPTFTPDTAAPTSTTSPAMSQPVQKGRGVLSAGIPSRTKRSRWFSAHALTRTSTSCGLILGSATSSYLSLSGPPNSWKASAFIRMRRRSAFAGLRRSTVGQSSGELLRRSTVGQSSGGLLIELLDHAREARIVERGKLFGLIERGAVEEPRVALLEARRDRRVGADDRIGLEHLVADEIGHALPVALHGLAVQLGHEVLPAVRREHGLVGAGGRIEGDLLLHRLLLRGQLRFRIADDDERGRDVREVGARAPGLGHALLDRRPHDLAQVLRAVERVHVQAVADLAGDPAHGRIDAGDVHGHARMLDGPGVEERRHEIEAEEPTLEAQLGPVLPGLPDRPHGQDDLAHLRRRRLELHREAPLVVALDLRAQPEDESPARRLREIPRDVGADHRAARKRDGDRRAELDPGRHGRGDGERQEGVVLGLGRPEAVVPERLDLARIVGDRFQVVRQHPDVELHEAHSTPGANSLALSADFPY